MYPCNSPDGRAQLPPTRHPCLSAQWPGLRPEPRGLWCADFEHKAAPFQLFSVFALASQCGLCCSLSKRELQRAAGPDFVPPHLSRETPLSRENFGSAVLVEWDAISVFSWSIFPISKHNSHFIAGHSCQ